MLFRSESAYESAGDLRSNHRDEGLPNATTNENKGPMGPGFHFYCVRRHSGSTEWTSYARIPLPQYVCVDLRRAQIPVTEQFLHRADVAAAAKELCRKGMPKRVTADRLLDRQLPDGGLDGLLHTTGMYVVADN